MLDRFVRLCEITSPTGHERPTADALLEELRELGVEVSEDDTAEAARAGSGNLVARVPGRGDRWVMFAAHMDTVPHDGEVEVVLENGVYRSAGETILGADNKAAVTVLMELAALHASEPVAAGIELVFTTAEEDGLRGAKEVDLEGLRSQYGFVLDHPTPIGEVITAAPTYKRLLAEFEGLEAHSGVAPEKGRSAIAAAAAAVNAMELGRLDEETTANVGMIDGGTASNIVPGRCTVDGEARSIDDAKASDTIAAMVDACTWAATEHGCDVDVDVREMFRGYRLQSTSEPVRIAKAALDAADTTPSRPSPAAGATRTLWSLAGSTVCSSRTAPRLRTPLRRASRQAESPRCSAVCEAIVELAGQDAEAP